MDDKTTSIAEPVPGAAPDRLPPVPAVEPPGGEGVVSAGASAGVPVTEQGAEGGSIRKFSGIWFPLAIRDLDVITRLHPECASSIIAVWIFLLREATFKRSCTISLTDSIIADRAKISRRTVVSVKAFLAEARLATYSSKKGDRTKRKEPTVWRLSPTVFFNGEPCAIGAAVAHGKPSAKGAGLAHGEPCATDTPIADAQSLIPPLGALTHPKGGDKIEKDVSDFPAPGAGRPRGGSRNEKEGRKKDFTPGKVAGSAVENWKGWGL